MEGRVSIAVLRRPASKCPALARRLLRIGEHALVNGAAVGDGELLSVGAFHGDVGKAVDCRRCPVGVYRNVLRGHGLAIKYIFRQTEGISTPACENIFLHADRRGRKFIISSVGNALLVFIRCRVYRLTAAYVHHIVAVAVVVEAGAIIALAVLSTFAFIYGKAGDIVAILF